MGQTAHPFEPALKCRLLGCLQLDRAPASIPRSTLWHADESTAAGARTRGTERVLPASTGRDVRQRPRRVGLAGGQFLLALPPEDRSQVPVARLPWCTAAGGARHQTALEICPGIIVGSCCCVPIGSLYACWLQHRHLRRSAWTEDLALVRIVLSLIGSCWPSYYQHALARIVCRQLAFRCKMRQC